MGKYFKKKVKKKRSKKPFIIAGIIAGIIILIIIIIVIIISIKKGMVPKYEVKTDIAIELNGKKPSTEDLFVTYKHMKESMVKVDWSELDISTIGTYNIPVTVTIDDEKDDRVIIATVADTTPPDLKVKDVTIIEGSTYTLSDFIESCTDNSTICSSGYDDNSYENITEVGTHIVKIKSEDSSNNVTIKSAKLIINAKEEPKPVDPTPNPIPDPTPDPTPTCEFGSTEKTSSFIYPITYSVIEVNNNCPMDVNKHDLNKHPNSVIEQALKSIYDPDLQKLWQETSIYVLKDASLEPVAVRNKEGIGFVGYSIHIKLYVDETNQIPKEDVKKDNKYLKEDYYLNPDGTRVYVKNAYNLK